MIDFAVSSCWRSHRSYSYHTQTHTHIGIHVCICICKLASNTHTQTHTIIQTRSGFAQMQISHIWLDMEMTTMAQACFISASAVAVMRPYIDRDVRGSTKTNNCKQRVLFFFIQIDGTFLQIMCFFYCRICIVEKC